jgi:hypothetical protein
MLIVVNGPWCPVCKSTHIGHRMEERSVAWTEKGAVKEMLRIPYCIDCDNRKKESIDVIAREFSDNIKEAVNS